MEKRYFQHLNYNDSLFENVTTLDYIDDSDPDMVLYHFNDGSKCNVEYIASINDMNAFGKMEFAELTSPDNKWKFKEEFYKEETYQQKGADGIVYESADPYTKSNNTPRKPIYKVIARPRIVRGYVPQQENVMPQQRQQAPVNNNYPQQKPKAQYYSQQPQQATSSNNIATIDADYMLSNNKIIVFTYNGQTWKIPASDFFANAVTYQKEKIVEKVVTKEQVVTKDEHIEIGIDDKQIAMINNMIDMSTKEECDINMEISLKLPPVSVYKLIKQVYPVGMSRGFVNIIADRMQMKELKTAVAHGLLAYYDEDAAVEIEEQEIEEQETKKQEAKVQNSKENDTQETFANIETNAFSPYVNNEEIYDEGNTYEPIIQNKDPENFDIDDSIEAEVIEPDEVIN